MRLHTPGEAAQVSGFSLDTLRYYERIGLIPEVPRTATARRHDMDSRHHRGTVLKCSPASSTVLTADGPAIPIPARN